METFRKRTCGACAYFRNDPAYLEQAFPGLTALGSGSSSTRAEDGLCLMHDCYLAADSACLEFRPRDAV
jgi:hypothetical protein